MSCPSGIVGRIIGKGGCTIKGIQIYTGAVIQVNQRVEPVKVVVTGYPESVGVATSMINDILAGKFKGFALLRQLAYNLHKQPTELTYAPGLGMLPRRQLHSSVLIKQQTPTTMRTDAGGDRNTTQHYSYGSLLASTDARASTIQLMHQVAILQQAYQHQASQQQLCSLRRLIIGHGDQSSTATIGRVECPSARSASKAHTCANVLGSLLGSAPGTRL